MLEYIILGFLMKHEMTGYDLKQYMTNSTSYFFDASFGSIYPALKRLEEKGLIEFREIAEGGKYKKIYQINDNGKAVFMEWLNEPIVFEKSKHTHLVKIFFYEFLPPSTAVMNIKELIHDIELVLKKLKDHGSKAGKECEANQYFYQYSTLEYGIDYYQFVILWCIRLIMKIEGKQL